jgi:hypothetical protein
MIIETVLLGKNNEEKKKKYFVGLLYNSNLKDPQTGENLRI